MSSASPQNQVEPLPPTRSPRPLLWAVILFLIQTALIISLIVYLLSDDDLYHPYRVITALAYIDRYFPEDVNKKELLRLARYQVFASLDRYSGYLDKNELNRVMEEFGGSYGGIGITVVGHKEGLMIMSVREDGPAGKAGMKTGDIILAADSVSMKGKNTYEATLYLRGPKGSPVTITLIRENLPDTLTLRLTREQLRLIHVPYAGLNENGIFYIRILDFESGATEELAEILDSLYHPNQDSVKGIILDLRGNPGGLLNEALTVANLFLDSERLIVGVKGRSRWRQVEYYSSGNDFTENRPLAIIIDRGSASAAEIVAGSLRYAGRALLVGDTSFGKGLVQEFDGFSDGSGIRLTTARYYFEGGVYLNDPSAKSKDSAAGIPPDFYVSSGETDDFITALERSLLLRDFALRFKDSLAPTRTTPLLSGAWLDRFAAFADSMNFEYHSTLTRELEMALELITFEGGSRELFNEGEKLYTLSREQDRGYMERYRDYILRRLYQNALEANFGAAVSYPRTILPYRQDIQLAESLLLSTPIP